MIITLTDSTYDSLNDALLASRLNDRKAALTHTRDTTVSVCRGFHINGEYVSLIKNDGNYLFIEAGDIITYDDGK